MSVEGDASSGEGLSLEVETIFFTNLMLLGFEPNKYEKKYRIVFNKNMFKTANTKGMEVIFHFLFQRLDPKKADKEFLSIWPLHGQNRAAFCTKVFNWLQTLREERKIHLLTLQKTVLQTCYGETFYNLLLEFSTYVLRTVLETEHPQYVNDDLPFSARDEFMNGFREEDVLQAPKPLSAIKSMQNVMMLQLRTQTRKFINHANRVVSVQNQWQDFANKITNEYKQALDREGALNEKQRTFESTVDPNIFSNESISARNMRMNQMQQYWSSLEEHHAKFKETRASINDIVHGKVDRARLDMDEMQAKHPEVDLNAFKFDPSNGTKQLKLDLGAMIDTWNTQLQNIQRNLERIPTERFTDYDTLSYLDQQSKSQGQYLSSLRNFSGEVGELIQDIKSSINNQKPTVTGTPQVQTPRQQPYNLHHPTPRQNIKLEQANDTKPHEGTPHRSLLASVAVHNALTPASEISRAIRQEAKTSVAQRVEFAHESPVRMPVTRYVSNEMLLFGNEEDIEKETKRKMKQAQATKPEKPQERSFVRKQNTSVTEASPQQRQASPVRERRSSAQLREKQAEDMARLMSSVSFTPSSGRTRTQPPTESPREDLMAVDDDLTSETNPKEESLVEEQIKPPHTPLMQPQRTQLEISNTPIKADFMLTPMKQTPKRMFDFEPNFDPMLEEKENIDLNNISMSSDLVELPPKQQIMFSPKHRKINVTNVTSTPTMASRTVLSAHTPIITPSRVVDRSINMSQDFMNYQFEDSFDGNVDSDDEETKQAQLHMLLDDVADLKVPQTPFHEKRAMQELGVQDNFGQDVNLSFGDFDFDSAYYPRKSVIDDQLRSQLQGVQEDDYLMDIKSSGNLTPDEEKHVIHYRRQSNINKRALSRLSMGPPRSTKKK